MDSLAYELGYVDGSLDYYLNTFPFGSDDWQDYENGWNDAMEATE